jgi:hypothetical protein
LCIEGRRLRLATASKQTYPCFACRKAGYEIPVYLDGKDEQGRTKYLNEDGTKHFHKTSDNGEDVRKNISPVSEINNNNNNNKDLRVLLESINEKVDRLINLAERK